MKISISFSFFHWLTSPLQVSSWGMGTKYPMDKPYEISKVENAHG